MYSICYLRNNNNLTLSLKTRSNSVYSPDSINSFLKWMNLLVFNMYLKLKHRTWLSKFFVSDQSVTVE